MENRIDQKFAQLKSERKSAFVAYLTAGDPSLKQTPDLVFALEKAGADLIELGIPFSDPLADGPVIQLSSQRAIAAGCKLDGIFETVKEIRKQSEIPLILFTYYNPVFHFGIERFCKRSQETGADGLLILDLPPEEAQENLPLFEKYRLKLIPLIAPTTPPERMKKIAEVSSGFIYYVSREGVTGMQTQVASSLSEKLKQLREASSLPICVGFGISNPEQARFVAQEAEGVVVGSALVDQIFKLGVSNDLAQKLEAFARPLADAIHGVKK